ncbi:hypothetical protein B5C34_12755 [Pacificimonas flava]|uniref:Uncharacterized protein n=2 Tax=Pacificimonas TaxID=1960290 RepID=A0A219B7K1_9SPHN|nr:MULTISPECIES: hypothetical protein [Pacificimonas]MBZ6378464.1 hypothetical protein [Pacificimonas aurantium]OWV34241.1 hypothetical protein B5C34_12755 [Pacificimonas flava]
MKSTMFAAVAAAGLIAVPAAADHHEETNPGETRAQAKAEMRDETPIKDSRGHVVFSQDAIIPAGYFGSAPDAAAKMNEAKSYDYPVCGPDQTDRCVQPRNR